MEEKNVQNMEELSDDQLESTSGGVGVNMTRTVYRPRCHCANKVSGKSFTCSNCGKVVTK